MRKISIVLLAVALSLALAVPTLAGPGTVVLKTDGDITARFGASIRAIPTLEDNWDFGLFDDTGDTGWLTHGTEAGTVGQDYVRTEQRIYFNFAKKDIWSVYIALENDTVYDQNAIDRFRDTNEFEFNIERIAAGIHLPWLKSTFYTGWDAYGVSPQSGAVYLDDDPGFWLKGKDGNVNWQVGYHKKKNGRNQATGNAALGGTDGEFNADSPFQASKNLDRIVYDVKVGVNLAEGQDIAGAYVLDHASNFQISYLTGQYSGKFGGLNVFGEFAYRFGDAQDTLGQTAFAELDVAAWEAFLYADVDLSESVGFKFVPMAVFHYASGDDDPNDNDLEGWQAVTATQRFGKFFGSEFSILTDGNTAIGTLLYSLYPELIGTINTGGIAGVAKGDAPGFWSAGVGLNFTPVLDYNIITKAYYMEYAEEQPSIGLNNADIGVAWETVLTKPLDKNMTVQLAASFLFPGDAIKDRTTARDGGATPGYTGSDDTLIKLAAELKWSF